MDRPRLLTPARPTGMTRRSVLGFGAAAASALLVPGCSRGRADEPAPAAAGTFVTGNPGGVYNVFGAALSALVSEVTGMELKPLPSNGSVDNLVKVASRAADLGFCTSDSALAAYEGTGEFSKGPLRFTALARVYDNYVHIVVPMASKAKELTDLNPPKDKPNAPKMVVSVGPKNSGTQIIADMILDEAKVDVKRVNMTLEQSVAALTPKENATRGSIDAFIWSGGVPTVPIAKLQSTLGFRLLDIAKVAQTIALKEFGGFVVSSIPPSQYGLASAVQTLAVPNYLIAKPGLSDSWAWWTVNTLFRRQNDLIKDHPEAGALDPRSAISTMPVPLHPAAERWYRQNHI
ncbi:TAXI family TRAP transporter solute-binding subunit [Kribbella sp. NPDC058693]|uniref:TAXI family TRAP transporter solute-binding subunit n=1 Tax=Kribbella jiaozuonensis TaxID=2575441 RepID=A0A4U3M0E2_9ACTN|nr:TAXI family TRAP transporter solute-binding subunit [Kribbella jiaozuonensis]TKK81740.1 TAXI family TRAP transporter solute-binding subunit [Kribbella jiaozuonensis]